MNDKLLQSILDSHINGQKRQMVQEIKDYPSNRYVLEDLLEYILGIYEEKEGLRVFAQICIRNSMG